MKKIRLDVAELEVSSFTTAGFAEQRGTVRGNSGYTCYHTVALYRTECVDYPMSYWGEASCPCEPVEDTDPSVCGILEPPTLVDATCPGVTGC
jgi:hypothetical protein